MNQIRYVGISLLACGVLPIVAGVSFAAAAPADARAAAEKSDDTSANMKQDVVLFRKTVDANRELIVVRSAIHPVTDIEFARIGEKARAINKEANLQESSNKPLIDGCFSISLQIVQSTGSPLTLATRLYHHYSAGPSSGEIAVFDVLVKDGNVVVAMGAQNTAIHLWRVVLFGKNGLLQMSDASLRGWSEVALASRIDRNSVSVTLSLLKDGRMQAEVKEPHAAQSARYIQDGEKWEFKIEPNK